MVKTIQKTEKASSVTEILKDIYKVLDKTAEYRALHMKATCTKGCSSCCYLFTSMGVPEGLLIAEHLLQSGKWEEILPSLKQAALDNMDVEQMVWSLGAEMSKSFGFGYAGTNICFAPIPVMVFFCMALITKGEPKVHEKILSFCDGILVPDHWMDEHMAGLLEEGSGIEKTGRLDVQTGLIQIGSK